MNMREILDLLGVAAGLGVRIPDIYVSRAAYDEICHEGEHDGPAPCLITVSDQDETESYETNVYPEDQKSATSERLS